MNSSEPPSVSPGPNDTSRTSPHDGALRAPTSATSAQPPSRRAKRTRVRQACNRCKARKIKCGDLRPCENCTSLGLVCKDWRPGEDPHQHAYSSAPGQPSFNGYASGSGSDHEMHFYQRDVSQASRSRAYSQSFSAGANPSAHHDSAGASERNADRAGPSSQSRFRTRTSRSESMIPWPNTPYERSTHSVAWPPRPDPERHRYLAYPYDSIYRNEYGHFKALSLSSGLGTLSYLHEYHKLANEQFLDALWQVLESDTQDSGNAQMFALESEFFTPLTVAPPGQIPGQGSMQSFGLPQSGQSDWSLPGTTSINVPYSFAPGDVAPSRAPAGRYPPKASQNTSPSGRPTPSSTTKSPSPGAAFSAASSSPQTTKPVQINRQKRPHDELNQSEDDSAGLSQQDRSHQEGSSYKRTAYHAPPPSDLWAYLDSQVPPQHRRSLIHTFLTTCYVLWPTFILSEFLATLKDPDQRRNPTFVCLVIACCAIAARQEGGSIKGGPAGEWGKSFDFYELYLDIRRFAPKHTDWASLNHIQALFYLSHYCFEASGPYGVTRAHNLINGCVSKCFDVGLHRSAETYTDAFTASEIEARRRTLWAVYCGDKISAAYGRPVMLRLSDIDVPEIDVDSPQYDERLPATTSFDQACTMRPFHRAAIRLFCVLERVVDKINLPACSSSAALERVMRKKPKRPRQSQNHGESCQADHEPIGFSEELEMVDIFQKEDTPTPTNVHQDDAMFHAHIERLRTTSAFIKIFIYRHLFCMANTNLSQEPPRLDYRDEMVKWCRELLLSQRKMIQRGEYTDFGSVMSYQLSQTGRGLIPAIYISSRLIDPSQDPNSAAIIKESKELLALAFDLLRQLSTHFTGSHRQLQIMQQAFKRLDLSLKKKTVPTASRGGADLGIPNSASGQGESDKQGATNRDGASSGLGDVNMGTSTSGLDLIAGVAGANALDSGAYGVSGGSNEEDDEDDEDETERDKKPGWISDLPINQPVEKAAPHTVNAFVGWSTGAPQSDNSRH